MEAETSLTTIETKSESYNSFSVMSSLIQPIPFGLGSPQLLTPKPSPEKSDPEDNADVEEPSDDESIDLDAQYPTAVDCVEQLRAFAEEDQGSLGDLQRTFRKAARKGTCIHLGWNRHDTRITRQLVLGPLNITNSNPSNPRKRVRAVHVPSYREMTLDAPTQVPSLFGSKMHDKDQGPIEGNALLLGRVKTHYRRSHENYGEDFEEGYIMAVLPDEEKRLVLLREDGERPIDGECEDEVVAEVTWRNLYELQKSPGNGLIFGVTEFTSWSTL